jgi:hypothetical protein
MTGAHGTVVRFGAKRVHIRLTKSLLEMDHDREVAFLPQHLEHGHHGDPRPQDKLPQLMVDMKRANVADAARLAAQAGVITEQQADELVQLWHEHTEP